MRPYDHIGQPDNPTDILLRNSSVLAALTAGAGLFFIALPIVADGPQRMEDTMELTIKSRNGKISDRQRAHIEEKLAKLERYLHGITSITVEVQHEQQRNAGEVYRVQTTLVAEHGVILRAEERAPDLYAAIDEVQEVLQRQISRYKEKYWRRSREQRRASNGLTPAEEVAIAEAEAAAIAAPGEAEVTPRVIRTKTFRLRPMFVDDAIEQMELLGHNFFIFQNAETMQINVLYRRRDGNYGVILPEVG